MADVFTIPERSRVMATVRSRGNKSTELELLAIFRRFHITGWRRHQPLPGRPDFSFRQARLAVFVDGCFWHGCPWHGRMPQSNSEYWERKIRRNTARDRLTCRILRQAGWRVLRIWAHSLRQPDRVAMRVISLLAADATATIKR